MAALAEPLDVTALAERLRHPLLKISRRLRQESQKAGVSVQDAILLGLIRKLPGIGVSELADAEQTSRPTMSGHVKRLEAAGWIRRTEDETDARRRAAGRGDQAAAQRLAGAAAGEAHRGGA